VLALPPDRQAAVAEEIVEAGLPLLLEKPLALDYEAALRILTAADNFGFIGLVDHLHLFAPEFQELVRQVRHRGVVRAISAISGNRGPGRDSWSVLWDWAPHDVAMMLKVVQASPVSVSATIVDCASDGTQVLENVRLVFEFADGMVTDITTGNAFYGRCREFTVSVDETTLSYVESPENQRSLVVAHGEDKQTVRVDSIAPLTAALAEFATRIRSGVGGEEDLALGAEVVRILCAANMSLRRGMAISIERVDYRATFGTVEC
jgi:predicted dehydrogenase